MRGGSSPKRTNLKWRTSCCTMHQVHATEMCLALLQILDWTRALPSLHEGSNLLLDKFEEMPWHDWMASATNDLLSEFSEPPPKLPIMIVTRMTEAAEQLGAYFPAMSGKMEVPSSRQPHKASRGLGSPSRDGDRQCMQLGRNPTHPTRVRDARKGGTAGKDMQGQSNLAGHVGMPAELLTAAHFAASRPLYLFSMSYPDPALPSLPGTMHAAAPQQPHSAQPAAGWGNAAVHTAGHPAGMNLLPPAPSGYPNPWSGHYLPDPVLQPSAQPPFMSFSSSLCNPHMGGASPAGYPLLPQHMSMPAGPLLDVQQIVEAAGFASLGNSVSGPPLQPFQQQVQQQLLQGSGLLNAQPPQLGGWGAGSNSLAQQLVQSACRTAAGGDAACAGGGPPLPWKPPTEHFAGKQDAHQILHALLAYLPCPRNARQWLAVTSMVLPRLFSHP